LLECIDFVAIEPIHCLAGGPAVLDGALHLFRDKNLTEWLLAAILWQVLNGANIKIMQIEK
jgi:hypothetical protein